MKIRTQSTVVRKPPTIPLVAPFRLVPGTQSRQSKGGPKAAPSPDQANRTNQKITGVWLSAKATPIPPITKVTHFPNRTRASAWRVEPRIFWR